MLPSEGSPCIICVRDFPSGLDWIIGATSNVRLHVGAIVALNDIELYRDALRAMNLHHSVLSEWPPPPCVEGTLAISTCRLGRAQLNLLHQQGVTGVLSTIGFRGIPSGWSTEKFLLSHAEVGGVTMLVQPFFFTYVGDWSLARPSVHISRDARTALSFSREFSSYMPAPLPEVHPLRAWELQPGVYHSRGLLPYPLSTSVRVAVATKFARRNYWGVRSLSDKEVRLCLDVPELLLDSPLPGLESYSPIGLLSAASTIPSWDAPSDPPPLLFGDDDDSDSSTLSSTPPPLGRPIDNHGYSDDETVTTAPSIISRDSVWELTGGDFILQSLEDSDSIAAQIQQEARERVATKSDDAEVPTYLWIQHCIDDSDFDWTEPQRNTLPKLMGLLEPLAHKWWLCNLRREFFTWMKCQRPGRYQRAGRLRDVYWSEPNQRYEWTKTPTTSERTRGALWGRAAYRKWFRVRYDGPSSGSPHIHNLCCGRDCLARAAGSSWWEWTAGSRPFFWRWPSELVSEARDGMRVPFIDTPPNYWVKQPDDKDEQSKARAGKKLQKVFDRGYIDSDTTVASLMSFFYVPKGEDDIRMVYDGTKCGLNDAVWVPSFFLPTMESHLRAVVSGTHMCDVDLGEMFLNFMMHTSMRAFCGIDVSLYDLAFGENPPTPHPSMLTLLAWNRIAMGLKWSPYQAVYFIHHAEEIIRGNKDDPTNVFRWERVRLNLPGSESYDPSLPWVSKVRHGDEGGEEQIAADLFTFVDDLRPTGSSKAESWQAGRRVASKINWLG